MSINNQEILTILESPGRITELSAGIQRRQELIEKIMDLQNPGKTKDLITITQDFKALMNLDYNELRTKYNVLKIEEWKRTYPDFKFKLEDGNIHATLVGYEGKTIPEFPPGLEELKVSGLCPNLDQETLDRIEEFKKK